MKSKSKIEKKMRRKDNPELIKTIIMLKKHNSKIWLDTANILSNSRRKNKGVNISKINKLTKANEVIVVPGKILSEGELNHALTIAFLKISGKARDKLKKAELMTIEQLCNKNREGVGVKIII